MISNDRIKYSEYTEYTEYVRNHCFSTKNVYLGLRTLFLELDVTRDDSSSSSVSSAPRLLGVVLVRTAAAGEGVMGAAARRRRRRAWDVSWRADCAWPAPRRPVDLLESRNRRRPHSSSGMTAGRRELLEDGNCCYLRLGRRTFRGTTGRMEQRAD